MQLANEFGVQQTSDNIEAANFADIIVLCVKPHFVCDVCQQLTSTIDISNKLFISVAAGTTVNQIQQALNCNAALVRVMPNTPSQLGLGMSGMFASNEVNTEQKAASDKLMSAVGKVIWLETEDKINAITAIAGSAPAYFFLFMEAMQAKAEAYGFDKQTSRKIVQQTALGAANMVVENSELDISTLRENVTSKGGTTQAALNTFVEGDLPQLVTNAIAAALQRAQEIAQNSK